MKKQIAVALAMITIIGCATGPTANERLQAQLGVAEAKLVGTPAAPVINRMVAQFGPPSVWDDGQGGKIYSWTETNTTVRPGFSSSYTTPGTYTGSGYSTGSGQNFYSGYYTPGQTYTNTTPPRVISRKITASISVDANGLITKITGNVH